MRGLTSTRVKAHHLRCREVHL